jgi:hypothetical protein
VAEQGTAGLDGVWRVERTGGLLPPLIGVWKQIEGDRGETKLGPPPGVPFRVEGLSLRYSHPLQSFVDVLEPDRDGFRGVAMFCGRPFERFRMTRPVRGGARP